MIIGGGFNHYTKQQGTGRYDFWDGYEPEIDNKTHSTDLLNARALQIVKSHAENPNSEPFFLYLAYPAAHDPLQVSKIYTPYLFDLNPIENWIVLSA